MRTATAIIAALAAPYLAIYYTVHTVRNEIARNKTRTREPWPVSIPTPNKKGTRP